METRKHITPSSHWKPNRRCLETKSFADHILAWSGKNFSEFPWRVNRSPYEILVAEVLLKRTTATAVSRVYEDFLERFPRLQDIAFASEEELIQSLSGVGLQRQRARFLSRLATWLLTTRDGDVPCDLASLLEVPGLGDYSAAAILSFGYGTPIAILDANVERIITRVFGKSLPPRPIKTMLNDIAQRLLPLDNHREYNYGLLDLGRLVCRYVGPKCDICPLQYLCDYAAKTGVENGGAELKSPSGNTHSKLKVARRYCGFSQQRLSELAGVSKLTIVRIESGKTSPRHRTIERLAKALNTEPEELLGFQEP